ncbi:MAG: M24 family metallopeptidase [Candidatus Bipolaricaulia bacterium]
MPVRLTENEFVQRRAAIRGAMAERRLDSLCIFSPAQTFYLTGLTFITTERPICAIYDGGRDRLTLFVPLLERERSLEAHVDDVRTYDEYPGERHPMTELASLLGHLELSTQCLGVDSDGYGGGFGYVGPKLSSLIPGKVVAARDLIERMMRIKSKEEVELIRESCKWGALGHQFLQEYTRPGLNETDISIRASYDASMKMVQSLGPDYRATHFRPLPVETNFRGQIGANSANPHAMIINATLRPGDVLITRANSEVGGYLSELERTMFLGRPTAEQVRFFDLAVLAQELALKTIRPGIPCSEVGSTINRFYRKNGIMPYWRAHTGHALGYSTHEAPFFDIGDHTIIEPGMVFSAEPGIFVPGLGGSGTQTRFS